MLTFGDQNQLKGQTLTKYKFKIPLPRLDLSKISSSVACSLPSSATSVAFRLSKNQSTINLHAPSADPQPSLLDHQLPYDIFTDRREGDSIKVSHVRNRSSPKLLTLVNQSHKSTASVVQDTYNYSSSNHQQQIHPLKPKEPETGVSMLIEEEESFNNSEKNHTNRLQLFEERPQNQKNGQLIKKMQNMFTRQDGEPNLGGQPRPYLRNNQYSSLPGSNSNHGELKAYFNEEAAKNTTRGAVAGNPKNQNEKEALALTLYPLVIRNPFSKVETPYVIDKTPVISVHSSIQTINNQEAPINNYNPSNNNVNSNNNPSNNNFINNNNNPSNNNVGNNNNPYNNNYNNSNNNNYNNSNNNNASNTNSNNTINNKHFFKFFRQSSRNANSQTVMNSPVFVPVNSMSYNSTTMPITNPCFVDANVSAKNIIFANNADNVNIAKAGEKKKIVELQAKLHPNGHRISKSHMTVVENKLLRIDVSKRQVPPLAELNLIDTNAANQQYKRAIQDHSLIDHQIQPTASQLARDAGPLTSRAGQNTMSKANNSFFTKANSNDNSFTKPKENLPLTFRRRIDVRKIVHLEADPNQNRVAQPNTLYGKLKDAILNVKNSCGTFKQD